MALTMVGPEGQQQAQIPDPVVSPHREDNRADAMGERSQSELARQIVEGHMKGLRARRDSDLLREKLLLHIDGSGDFQWADIFYGNKVMIPRLLSPYRKTENVLRLLVDNAVAHHTTMPLRFFAESLSDRRARERSIMDTVFINDLAQRQDFNGLFAEALYMAMATGFCPVHAYWRDDLSHDWYDPVGYGTTGQSMTPDGEESGHYGEGLDPRHGIEYDEQGNAVYGQEAAHHGMIDAWVGNPFDTVFDRAATRRSIRWCSYGRLLPARAVREAFGHVPGVDGLTGSTRIPSASVFQRIARSWDLPGAGAHGKSVMGHRQDDGEEMMTVICREVAPKHDSRWPEGRLQCVAIPGEVDTRRGMVKTGHAVLLADQPLPARTYSFSNFYSHHRGDDVHGKPWAEDVDQLQVDLNIALSKRWEYVNKVMESPIVAPGGMIADQMADIGGYNLLEVDQSMSSFRPTVMEWPVSALQAINNEIEDKRQAMYTGGGYQASSRGESPGSRTPYRAIVALQEADRTIHGPVNNRFQRSACDFARRCWAQMKEYGDIGWIVNITGDEYEHLAEAYIDNTRLSEEPPQYKLVNAFGSSPEMLKQEVLELMQVRGADGEPFLLTSEARKAFPDSMIFEDAGDPESVKRRRAKSVAQEFHNMADRLRRETGLNRWELSDPQVQEAAEFVFHMVEEAFPRLRDDDLDAHLSTLSEVTQDESSDPIARLAAMKRQELYYEWQAMMAGMPPEGQQAGAEAQGAPGQGPEAEIDRMGIAAEMQGGPPTEGHGGVAAM